MMGVCRTFHDFLLMYVECDLNVTRAPSICRSKIGFAPFPVLKNLTFIIHIQPQKFWQRFDWCARKCNLNRFVGWFGHTPRSNAWTGTLKNGHRGSSVRSLTNSITQTVCTRDAVQISASSRVKSNDRWITLKKGPILWSFDFYLP